MNNYGQCRFCGAPNTRSRTTGNIYCSEKCWLNTSQQSPPSRQPQRQEPDWDKIREEKSENIRENVILKEACEFVRTIYQKGEINSNQIIPEVAKMFDKLMEMNDAKSSPENYEDLPEGSQQF